MCVGERESRSKAKSEDWIGKVLSEIRLVLLVLLLLLVFDNRNKKRVRKRYYYYGNGYGSERKSERVRLLIFELK